MASSGDSRKGKGVVNGREQGGKYARYNEVQTDVLENAFAERSNPDHFQRAKILHDHPVLKGIDNRQLKVWFQNRRSREKQKKESADIVIQTRQLIEEKNLLKELNDGLCTKVSDLACDNEHLENKVVDLTSRIATFVAYYNHHSEADYLEMAVVVANNNTSLLSLAEETRNEFLPKATGKTISWIRVPELKLDIPDVIGTVYISSTCIGVAARACATIPFEPFKTMEMLKDRPSWSRLCRSLDVLAKYPASNGGSIELIHTKYYAPTTMALARDFWTLRYSSVLDDGSLVVCEKSISGPRTAPSTSTASEFVRGRMLVSGYMICPGEGGSTIYLLENFDFETSSVPEVVRPFYESSELLANMTIISAFRYIGHVAKETNGKLTHVSGEEPTFLRSFGQSLSRGFNDAVNCFSEDGWTLMYPNACDDVIMSTKRTANFGLYANCDSVLCLKTSLLLQNVYPATLVKLLKERRSDWMGFNFDEYSVASRSASFAFPCLDTFQTSEFSVPLGHTNHEDEALDIIRLENIDSNSRPFLRDLHHLQMSNGMEDNGFGACSELIFAPIDGTITNEAAQLSCGLRIILLGSNTASFSHTASMLTMAFQFPYEEQHQDEIEAVARLYVQHVMSSVQNISLEVSVTPSDFDSTMDPTGANLPFVNQETRFAELAELICQCYRSALSVDMLGFNCETSDSMFELIHHHRFSILCFSFELPSNPVCMYANKAALSMLQTKSDNLRMLKMDRLFGGSEFSLVTMVPAITQQGYAILPSGRSLSAMNVAASYEQCVAWRVQPPDGSFNALALAFLDWAFI